MGAGGGVSEDFAFAFPVCGPLINPSSGSNGKQ